MSEITAAEKKLEVARNVLFQANEARMGEVRKTVELAKRRYIIGKKKGDINMMKRAKKSMRKNKKKMGKILRLSKARKRQIMVSKRLDDDKYMADQDNLLSIAKGEIIKAEQAGRFRAIMIAKQKYGRIKMMKNKQQKALNSERIRDADKELKITKMNVEAAMKTKNFDLINIARRELRHARLSVNKANVIKIEMANKIMEEKEEKRARYVSRRKSLRKEVRFMWKRSNIKLLKAKK